MVRATCMNGAYIVSELEEFVCAAAFIFVKFAADCEAEEEAIVGAKILLTRFPHFACIRAEALASCGIDDN